MTPPTVSMPRLKGATSRRRMPAKSKWEILLMLHEDFAAKTISAISMKVDHLPAVSSPPSPLRIPP